MTTIVYEELDVAKDEEIDSEGETYHLGNEVNAHDNERKRTAMVEIMDEEEEMENTVNIRYPKRQRQKNKI